jgi:hypothetical protein
METTGAGLFRRSRLDAWLVAAALAPGALLAALLRSPPALPSVSAGLAVLALAVSTWWGANTVSHNHLHVPLFRSPRLNALFSLYLSLLLGVPQKLWRSRHLWHHAGERPEVRRLPLGPRGWLELVAVAALFGLLLVLRRDLFLFVYAPGYLIAMGLCTLQGRYEHGTRPVSEQPGISCYGRLYNLLWFNDGYHLEHHHHPGEHWSRLPAHRPGLPADAAVSRWPPVLRWLERGAPPSPARPL